MMTFFERDFDKCCEEFYKASSAGSDNECYGPAIKRSSYNLCDGYEIGMVEGKIKFCPWCGKDK